MTTATITLNDALHAYRAAKAQLQSVRITTVPGQYNVAYKVLQTALDRLESMMPTDADLAFIRDDAGIIWAIEWGANRRTGAGWPDSSFPTVSAIDDLICN
jgi:hypothetical protein